MQANNIIDSSSSNAKLSSELTLLEQLPVEIFTAMLREVLRGPRLKERLQRGGWAKLMLVCRRFYQVLEKDQYLWSFISNLPSKPGLGGGLSLVARATRAGKHPLTCYLDFQYYSEERIRASSDLLVKFCDTIEELTLRGGKYPLARTCGLITSFPTLRSLSICEVLGQSGREWTIPEALVKNGLPALSQLTIEHHQPPPLHHFPHITHLTLSLAGNVARPSLATIYNALVSWPNLISLNLSHAWADGTPETTPTVRLPKLGDLTLLGDSGTICALLALPELMPSLHHECRMDIQITDQGSYIAILDLIKPRFSAPGFAPFTSMKLVHGAMLYRETACDISFDNQVLAAHPREQFTPHPIFRIGFNLPTSSTIMFGVVPVLALLWQNLPFEPHGIDLWIRPASPHEPKTATARMLCSEVFVAAKISRVTCHPVCVGEVMRGLTQTAEMPFRLHGGNLHGNLHVPDVALLPSRSARSVFSEEGTFAAWIREFKPNATMVLPNEVAQSIFFDVDKLALELGQFKALASPAKPAGVRIPRLTLLRCPSRSWAEEVQTRFAQSGVASYVGSLEFSSHTDSDPDTDFDLKDGQVNFWE